MQVAHRRHVLDMLDGAAMRALIARGAADLVVPEIEAIHTADAGGTRGGVASVARRRGHPDRARRAPDHGPRRHPPACRGNAGPADLAVPLRRHARRVPRRGAEIGMPCVVKPVMSSSGKGQTLVRTDDDIDAAWDYAQTGGRAGAGRVIVEGFIDFDYEITLLTVRHAGGTDFLRADRPPAARRRLPRELAAAADVGAALRARAGSRARITDDLGGWGVFGVELFVQGRRGLVLGSLAAPARYRPGHAGVAGPQPVRAARARDPRPADPGDPPAGPVGFLRGAGAWPRRAGVRRRRCARCGAGHAAATVRQARVEGHRRVASPWRGARTSKARGTAREPPRRMHVALRYRNDRRQESNDE